MAGVLISGISAIVTALVFPFIAATLDLALSAPLALCLSVSTPQSPEDMEVYPTATGTRFLDPPVVLLSGSDDGVVRLLK